MCWPWIIGAILLLFFLFCQCRLGIRAEIGMPVCAWVTFGPFRIQVAPSKPQKKKAAAQKKKAAPKKNLVEHLKNFPKPSLEDLKTAYRMLWPPTKRALRRTRRSIKLNPLRISFVLAGKNDPAAAAEKYGLLNGAVWMGVPALEQLINIPNPNIHIGVDFDAERNAAEGQLGLSIRIGTLLAVGLELGIPALRWFLKYRKAHPKKHGQAEKKQPVMPAA